MTLPPSFTNPYYRLTGIGFEAGRYSGLYAKPLPPTYRHAWQPCSDQCACAKDGAVSPHSSET